MVERVQGIMSRSGGKRCGDVEAHGLHDEERSCLPGIIVTA